MGVARTPCEVPAPLLDAKSRGYCVQVRRGLQNCGQFVRKLCARASGLESGDDGLSEADSHAKRDRICWQMQQGLLLEWPQT